MRLSILFCSAALALASSFAHAAEDTQLKCQQKLSANAEKIAQVKQLAGLLGNQQANDAIAQVEGGCDQLGANAATSGETVAQAQGDSKADNIAAAAETLKGLGSLFGK
ncbi:MULTISPECIES: hypothetical protein [Pseudomonas]|uniref:DUF1090 family protein n=2 Tax=Pseudomonadaceae TaxID=135621 RepID=A0A1G8DZA3_9GAMM|nr:MULTISPECIES: hypothetical protein [Pseudomonas]KIQ05287.1 hypothetical protein RU08_03590 [Pseudomonas fulva]MCW2294747.1 hypothetical protein [Pseudomonas sp. BIGb0408]NYH75979.1 hypothetical protein [Pseudomonas flavescens]SDH62891.1 hypothetical protein SAMN05216588_10615 [Pseudomonas flavescens]